MQLQFNLIPFKAPENPVSFHFFKMKKDDSFRPLKKDEYPAELVGSYEHELADIQNLYCNFSETETNPDYTVYVDLNNSTLFAIHYFRHLLWKYFLSLDNVVVSPNFINDIEILIPAKAQNEDDITIYYCFTIKLQHARISEYFEMVISYDGVTRQYMKPVSQLGDIDAKHIQNVVLDKQTYNYRLSNSIVNYRLDEAFPIISNTLKKILNLSYENNRTENKYINTKKLIQGFCQNHIFSKGFGNILNLMDKDLYILPSDKVKTLPDNSNDLLFSDYLNNQQIDKSPLFGFKKIGPFKTANIKGNNLKIFFIYQESTGLKARDYYYEALLNGAIPATFRKDNGQLIDYKKIKPLSKAIRQHFSTDPNGDITFTNLNTALNEIKTKLNAKNFVNGNTYLAIYVSPINKDSREDTHYQTVYAGIKELIINKGATIQCIYENRYLEDSIQFQFTNIQAAILAKIGGTPWKLSTTNHNNLIIGVGAFYSSRKNKRYIGSAFRFDGSGVFHEFSCFHESEHETLIAKIRSALKDYIQHNEGNPPQRIIIHFYKKMSKDDWKPILRMLKGLKYEIPIIVATIFKTESKDIVAFDNDCPDLMPLSGTYIPIDDNTFLLYNNAKYKQESWDKSQDRKTYSFPIKIKLDSKNSDILNNEGVIEETLVQIYQLSRMYWKSVDQQNIPITVKYPEMIAEIVPYFQSENIPNPQFGCRNLWFL